jgi:hypothetical protein
MPVRIEGELYYNASEAADYLGISRPTFNKNVKPYLPEYRYGAFRRVVYRESDLDHYRGVRRVDNGDDS